MYFAPVILFILLLIPNASRSLSINRVRNATGQRPYPLNDEWRVAVEPSLFAKLEMVSMGNCKFYTPSKDAYISLSYPCTLSLTGLAWNTTLYSLNGTLRIFCDGVSVATLNGERRGRFYVSRNHTHLRVLERTVQLQEPDISGCQISGDALTSSSSFPLGWDSYFCPSIPVRVEWSRDTLSTRHWVLQGSNQPYFLFTLWDLVRCYPEEVWDWSLFSSHLTFHLNSGAFKLFYALHAPWQDSFQGNSSLIKQPTWRV